MVEPVVVEARVTITALFKAGVVEMAGAAV
jgi:hypothetical protein